MLFSFTYLQAQDIDACGAIERTVEEMELLPWFGNNEYLNTIHEQAASFTREKNPTENKNANNCDEIESDWMIPVRFWIYQANANDLGLPDDRDLQIMMDELNRIYQSNGMNVRFFMICPQYVTNEDALTMNDWNAFWSQFAGNNTDASAINVHIIEDIEDAGGSYYSVGDFIVVERDVYGSLAGATTLAHEIGHYFGLDHTHRNHDKEKCRQESVSRSRKFPFPYLCFKTGKICEKNGDALCDTPADPNISGSVNIDCIYSLAETDNWGDVYVPDTRNIMSYSRRSCRDNFTNGQVGIMWWSIFWSGYRNFIQLIDMNEINPDRFEPDDSEMSGVPRLITIEEMQCHSFHRIGDCQDEVDWLRIDNNSGILGSYIIEIDDADNYENPVEEIRVWNTDAVGNRTSEIVTSFSQTGTVRKFEVACTEIQNDFLVEVVKKDDIDEGAYTIKLNTSISVPLISASQQACIGNNISIINAPFGSTVTWSASPSLTLNASTGNTVTITNTSSMEPYWVGATITHNGCSYTLEKEFIGLGASALPTINAISMQVVGPPCEPTFVFSIPTIQGATNYIWDCQSNNASFDGCYGGNSNTAYGSAVLDEGQSISMTVNVTATNDCGAATQKSKVFNYTPVNCDIHIVGEGGTGDVRIVRVIPNPVNSTQFTVEITDNLTEINEYQIIITNLFGEMKYLLETNEKINQVNADNLSDGIYYLHVITDENVTTANFIVQNY